nr:ABC transporter ATP-binding protein [Propionicimonas sp.]
MNAITTDQPAIRVRGLQRDFGRFRLGPIDLDLPVGYVTGLVGANGAGKTTLLKAMLGLIRIDACTVHPDTGDGPSTLAGEDVGVVFDQPTLIPEWTATQAAQALRPFSTRWDDQLFTGLIDRFRIARTGRVGTLSRGETTKLSLALALARRPRLLILDEPTSGLDPAARRVVLDLFREFMAADDGHTILFSTHITGDLDNIADHLRVIDAGRIVEAGTLDDVLERYAVVRGATTDLTAVARHAVRGLRENAGAFHGLIATADTALFGPDALIEPAGIDDIVVHLGQPDATEAQR